MALPSSGAMKMGGNLNVELGNASTAQISLGQATVRTLYGVSSGAIRLAADGYSKSSTFTKSITANQQQLNLRTWAVNNGWNGTTAAVITVNSGIYIWSDDITVAALTINGSWPGGVTLINNGYIIGKGGRGGSATLVSSDYQGQNGGPAISLGVNCSITNGSGAYIAGGGGGGGVKDGGGGGGAGGGAGGRYDRGGTPGTGGAGGAVGSAGSDGVNVNNGFWGGGGGGGRILPGTGGAAGNYPGINGKGGGAGGGGAGCATTITYYPGPGGPGGSAGNAAPNVSVLEVGQPGGPSEPGGAGGGGWGAKGGDFVTNVPGYTGGTGGKAIALNGYTATRTGSGTTYGAVS